MLSKLVRLESCFCTSLNHRDFKLLRRCIVCLCLCVYIEGGCCLLLQHNVYCVVADRLLCVVAERLLCVVANRLLCVVAT